MFGVFVSLHSLCWPPDLNTRPKYFLRVRFRLITGYALILASLEISHSDMSDQTHEIKFNTPLFIGLNQCVGAILAFQMQFMTKWRQKRKRRQTTIYRCVNVCNMADTMAFFSHFAVIFVLCASFALSLAEEACYSYAGGHVYPQETRYGSGHSFDASKARSMWRLFIHP